MLTPSGTTLRCDPVPTIGPTGSTAHSRSSSTLCGGASPEYARLFDEHRPRQVLGNLMFPRRGGWSAARGCGRGRCQYSLAGLLRHYPLITATPPIVAAQFAWLSFVSRSARRCRGQSAATGMSHGIWHTNSMLRFISQLLT